MQKEIIIHSFFQFKNGDVMQICEDGTWTDLGVIKNSRAAAVDFAKNNGVIVGKPARVVRR